MRDEDRRKRAGDSSAYSPVLIAVAAAVILIAAAVAVMLYRGV